MNDLRDGPDQQRPAERRGDLRQPRQHTITVRRPFGKPDAGIDDEPLARDAGGDGRARSLTRSSAITSATTSPYTASAYIVSDRAARVHQDERGPGVRDDARQRRIVASGR